MSSQDVTLTTPDGPMRAYDAAPNDARTAVIVIPEAFGLNGHIEEVTDRFAAAGHRAVGLDIFHRSGGGTAPYDDFSKVLPLFEGLTDEGLLDDIDAARAHLHGAGLADGSIGIVGFCFGGRTTFLAALRRPLGASVGFYGGGIVTGRFPQFPELIDESARLQSPWLGLFGDADGSIPVEDVERLRATLDAETKVDHDIVRYADAEHGFHCDQRPSFHADAAADGWQRTLAWFADHLG
ncbi:MAG TPA: dienelactone hydrolase family protein [Acidimicrobiales bacterium]|jgi:carboxymethylenebutenolidase|nr:dienelactone hydrolase family protein [Acidimicrobiales bacterium]